YSARHRRTPRGRSALGVALAATVLCAGGVSVATFGLLNGTPADAGATFTPASVTTAPPRLTRDPTVKPLARSVPVSIRIPAISISAAVILGHVDSLTGISVFYYLKDLRARDKIYVTLADGKTAAFAVDGVQKVSKDAFP